MDKNFIIIGEASETDSENESNNINNDHVEIQKSEKNVKGEVIHGEDSESDEDDIRVPIQKVNSNYDGILHKKLQESNNMLRNSIDQLVLSNTNEMKNILLSSEQDLMRSQNTLQNSLTSFKTLNGNSENILTKLKCILESNFFSDVKTNIK